MNVGKVFGIVLKKLRGQSRLSQEQLASQCDLDRTFISLLERGQRQPSMGTLFSIARALDVTASEIVALVERQARRAQIRGED